jgi:aspartate aminotransferase-like enzyme
MKPQGHPQAKAAATQIHYRFATLSVNQLLTRGLRSRYRYRLGSNYIPWLKCSFRANFSCQLRACLLLVHVKVSTTCFMGHVKLHIPGPVEVSEKTFRAFCSPMIGHRGQGFKDLYARIQPQLQALFGTRQLVYLSTSSAWGVMEGAIRNLVGKKVLCCMCGAFSDKWLDVAQRCGKPAEGLRVDWGSPILPNLIDAKLASGQFDTLTLIHNETSTGVMSPLAEISQLKKKYPDVLFIVDAVSSLTAISIPFDTLGIDVLLAGTQKALAMPPGLAVFTTSEAARARAAAAQDRGYYFDFIEFQKNAEQHMTPSTPSIGHVYALSSKLEDIFQEGLQARYQRHAALAKKTRAWAQGHGFTLFPETGFESVTLTCVNNGAKPGGRIVDVAKLQKLVKDQGFLIDGGYGKIKGTTFRISSMGDETEATMQPLYAALDFAMMQL